MNTFEDMPQEARVWVYSANRKLDAGEKNEILAQAREFVSGWTAHENQLKAAVDVLHDLFLVFMVDERFNAVSGCGIDKSVGFVKKLGERMNLDFFNRMQLEFVTPNGVITCSRTEAAGLQASGLVNDETTTFNKTVSVKSEFDTQFTIPYRRSWAYPKKAVNA